MLQLSAALRELDPLVGLGVILATALTDAAYVMFTASVAGKRRFAAAHWSSIWYLLSSFAVISYTANWAYVVFAAAGSWIGAFATMTFLHHRAPAPPLSPPPAVPPG